MNAADEIEAKPSPLPRVLVVDDESCVFEVFQNLLPSSHYALTLACDGRQALELAGSRQFDLAFVDYFLAELNGAEVAQKMRALQPALRIVLMSCYSEHKNREAMMAMAGASDWVSKPLTVANTRAVAERMLRERAVGRTA